MDPEMSKLVQESLNEYIINQSQEITCDDINIAAAEEEDNLNETANNVVQNLFEVKKSESNEALEEVKDDVIMSEQVEQLAKDAEHLSAQEQQEVLELLAKFEQNQDQQQKSSEINNPTVDSTEKDIVDIESQNQALVSDILQPLQQFLPQELIETMSEAIKDNATSISTTDERPPITESNNTTHQKDQIDSVSKIETSTDSFAEDLNTESSSKSESSEILTETKMQTGKFVENKNDTTQEDMLQHETKIESFSKQLETEGAEKKTSISINQSQEMVTKIHVENEDLLQEDPGTKVESKLETISKQSSTTKVSISKQKTKIVTSTSTTSQENSKETEIENLETKKTPPPPFDR
jgi:hypothetical protein